MGRHARETIRDRGKPDTRNRPPVFWAPLWPGPTGSAGQAPGPPGRYGRGGDGGRALERGTEWVRRRVVGAADGVGDTVVAAVAAAEQRRRRQGARLLRRPSLACALVAPPPPCTDAKQRVVSCRGVVVARVVAVRHGHTAHTGHALSAAPRVLAKTHTRHTRASRRSVRAAIDGRVFATPILRSQKKK